MITKISKILSAIFQPVLIPTYGACLLAFFDPMLSPYLPLGVKMWIIGIVLVFTGVIPAAIVLSMLWFGKVSNGFIANKDERTLPYILSMLSYFMGIYFLWRINLPLYWIAVIAGSSVCIILILLINFHWKISAHSASMGGITGGLIAMGMILGVNNIIAIIASVLLSGIVCSARVHLKAHTVGQTLAGWTLGATGVALSIMYVSYL